MDGKSREINNIFDCHKQMLDYLVSKYGYITNFEQRMNDSNDFNRIFTQLIDILENETQNKQRLDIWEKDRIMYLHNFVYVPPKTDLCMLLDNFIEFIINFENGILFAPEMKLNNKLEFVFVSYESFCRSFENFINFYIRQYYHLKCILNNMYRRTNDILPYYLSVNRVFEDLYTVSETRQQKKRKNNLLKKTTRLIRWKVNLKS